MFKLVIVSMFLSLSAFASDVNQYQTSSRPEPVLQNSFNDVGLEDEEEMDFIGCFRTRRACRIHGIQDGYHHVQAVHDHETCGSRRPYACYGE